MRKIKIPLASKLVISLFSIVYSALSLWAGSMLARFIPLYLGKIFGVVILFVMGIWIIIQSYFKPKSKPNGCTSSKKIKPRDESALFQVAIKSLGVTIQVVRNPVEVDLDHSGSIDTTEALFLGLALSLDAIGASIGSALAGFSVASIPFCIGLFQISFLYAGTFLGRKLTATRLINEKILTFTPGILLIFLAILRLR